jgi:hypothetical protein
MSLFDETEATIYHRVYDDDPPSAYRNFVGQARYHGNRFIVTELQVVTGREKELAHLLSLAVEKGIVRMDRLEAAFALARTYVADQTASTALPSLKERSNG